jgi:hypothetical protein
MSNEEAAKLVANLFSDRRAMDQVIRRAHAAVVQRHAAWKLPLIVWKNDRVEAVAPTSLPDETDGHAMPSMWVL